MYLIVPFIDTNKQLKPLWIKKGDFIKKISDKEINPKSTHFCTSY